MTKSLLVFFTAIFFLFSSVGALFFLRNILSTDNSSPLNVSASKIEGKNVVSSPIDKYYANTQAGTNVLAAVGKSDTRPVIIDNFLSRHNSPMKGLGTVFVKTADQYGLDYRLLPAIAFQESTLGKKIPRGSHNAWGWAIYTGENSGARFQNWEHAIQTVAKGLKEDYIDRGLHTPEAIMTRYTDGNDGSWASGVYFAINEMTPR